jgi:hypothetical protein
MFSQLVTLFLTPVVYIYLEQAQQWTARVFGKGRRRVTAQPATAAGPAPHAGD